MGWEDKLEDWRQTKCPPLARVLCESLEALCEPEVVAYLEELRELKRLGSQEAADDLQDIADAITQTGASRQVEARSALYEWLKAERAGLAAAVRADKSDREIVMATDKPFRQFAEAALPYVRRGWTSAADITGAVFGVDPGTVKRRKRHAG
ncbi:MAG: hypothetical protein AAF851_20275 [Myxococcota bacterium]